MSSRVFIEPIKTLAHGSIGAAYATVGVATTNEVRLVCITNNTEGDMYFSIDGSTNQLFVAAGAFKLFDLQANYYPKTDPLWVLPVGTQFYVKQITAPVSGAVYIECLY